MILMKMTKNISMKKVTKIENTEPYSSPELDAFLALEETINTDYIRTSMLLAAQIEDAMLAKGIGKKQFADLLGKKPSVITKWLSGTHNFEINTLTQIANALNIKLFAFDMPSDKETIVLNPNVTYQFRLDNPIGKTQPFSRI
jgi:ribosome-binding protein aMBF1 (putative translation factor)